MDPFTTGWLMGVVTGLPAGVMATLTYQWWTDRRVRRVEVDNYVERLRALQHADDEYLMAQLRKANREGQL